MSDIIEGKPQLPPGMCFLCEQSNPCRYIDTFRDFEGVVREKLDGRKYVCEECVEDMAKHLGFVTPKAYTDTSDERKALQDEVNRLKHELEDFKVVKEALDRLQPAPKAPARKPAAAKA